MRYITLVPGYHFNTILVLKEEMIGCKEQWTLDKIVLIYNFHVNRDKAGVGVLGN